MAGTYTVLKDISQIADSTLEEHIQVGLQYFFNWGLLNIGAFQNVTIPTSGQYGGTSPRHRLRASNDQNFERGQVWEGFRKEWVWESGLEYNKQPIQVSGVYVDGTFYPIGTTGDYSHYVDYPNGRIVFDNAISPTSVVTAEFSYRNFPFFLEYEPWFREVQFRSYRNEDTTYITASGNWNVPAPNRIQLPAVVIEVGRSNPGRGLALGGGQIAEQHVIFHILSENPHDAIKMRDVIKAQNEKTIFLFNLNHLADFNRFPLTPYGSLSENPPSYPQLVSEPSTDPSTSGFRWRRATLTDVFCGETVQISPMFYWTTSECVVEVEMPKFT